MDKNKEDLKKRIREEMTVNYIDVLERNLERVKKYILVTNEGKIDLLIKDEVENKEKILLYLIGKMYAKVAELSETEQVGNKELITELSMPEGSVKPILKSLREKGKINHIKEGKNVFHSIKPNLIERILKSLNEKTG